MRIVPVMLVIQWKTSERNDYGAASHGHTSGRITPEPNVCNVRFHPLIPGHDHRVSAETLICLILSDGRWQTLTGGAKK